MSDHPDLEELQGFWRGELDSSRVRVIVRHLLHGCRHCGALLAYDVSALFGAPNADKGSRGADKAYDAVLDRVFARVAGGTPGASGEIEASREAAPAEFTSLLDRCQRLRYDDPAGMVELARFAAFMADRFDPRRYGARQVADLRSRAWAELANAYRVADRLQEAEEALEIAGECQVAGTHGELLAARLLEVQASLDADRRRFPEAQAALDEIHALHVRRGDRHLSGRALLKKGLYAGYDGDPALAIRLLEEGLARIDREREPELVFGALHNLARALLQLGRPEEAKELLRQNSFGDPRGRVSRLTVRWLEGQIDAGLGNFAEAERALDEVRRAFAEIHLRYKAALAGLELAAVHLRQGRSDDARDRGLEALAVFSRLDIAREIMAALVVLREAFEQRIATVAVLEGVIARLARMEREPAA